MEQWQCSVSSFFKINFDIAIKDTLSAQAAIYRDPSGNIIKTITIISLPCDPTLGAKVALLAARMVLLWLSHFILEGDSLLVALALQFPDITQDWRISSTKSAIFSTIPTSSF